MKRMIVNAKILSKKEDRLVNIFIDGDFIEEIVEVNESYKILEGYEDCKEIIDVNNKYVLPGLVDLNCELTEPGFEHKENILSLSKAGLKGGYTTINCIPRTNPAIDNKIVVSYLKNKMKQTSNLNMLLSCNMTKHCGGNKMSEISDMKNEGIDSISDGNETLNDSNLLRNILTYTEMFNLPIILSCEDKNLKGEGVLNLGKTSTNTGLRGIPNSAEELIVARNIILSKEVGRNIHLTKLGCKNSIKKIEFAQKSGLGLTCDTTPQYFTFTDECAELYDTSFKISPPLRSENDRRGIIEGLKKDIIGVITSGHSPNDKKDKMKEFEKASNGISTIETAFYTSYNELVVKGELTLYKLIEKMSKNPCKILNIKNKGEIKKGYIADFFIFDEEGETVVDVAKFESKFKFSPYDGKKYKGKIISTIVGGKVVY